MPHTRLFRFCLSLAALLLVCGSSLPGQHNAAEQILPRVQSVLRRFFTSLPDFVCTEDADLHSIAGGRQRAVHAVSSFAGLQKPSGFAESRRKLFIDGRPVPAQGKQPILKNVFHYGGGFSAVLNEMFSSETAPWQRYTIAGSDSTDGVECVVLDLETDESVSRLSVDWFGKQIHARARGRAWISRESMQVLKLERDYFGLPGGASMHVAVDYAQAQIGGRQYLMPRNVRASVAGTGPHSRETWAYAATYTNYRKFEVESGIVSR